MDGTEGESRQRRYGPVQGGGHSGLVVGVLQAGAPGTVVEGIDVVVAVPRGVLTGGVATLSGRGESRSGEDPKRESWSLPPFLRCQRLDVQCVVPCSPGPERKSREWSRTRGPTGDTGEDGVKGKILCSRVDPRNRVRSDKEYSVSEHPVCALSPSRPRHVPDTRLPLRRTGQTESRSPRTSHRYLRQETRTSRKVQFWFI